MLFRSNKNAEREKLKSRIILGAAFERWRQLKDEMGLKTNACVAVDLVSKFIPFILGNTGVETSVGETRYSCNTFCNFCDKSKTISTRVTNLLYYKLQSVSY